MSYSVYLVRDALTKKKSVAPKLRPPMVFLILRDTQCTVVNALIKHGYIFNS